MSIWLFVLARISYYIYCIHKKQALKQVTMHPIITMYNFRSNVSKLRGSRVEAGFHL